MHKLFPFKVLLLVIFTGCTLKHQQAIFVSPADVTCKWADMTLYITKNTFANTPTYSSRALGYIGLTMYESVVHGFRDHRSLAGQLNDLDSLPMPDEKLKYNWLLSLNAGQSFIIKKIYNQTPDENKQQVDSLEKLIYESVSETENDQQVIQRSVEYGVAVANAIFEWSKTDSGYRGYLHNFDPSFKLPPNTAGMWAPALYSQVVGHMPLHPHWGKNRAFLKENSLITPPQFIVHDGNSTSVCFAQFKEVYDKNKTLTQQEKEIAVWWNDDPSETITPPGHSYNLASICIKKMNPTLIKAAESYAKIGLAVADAFTDCWKWKYIFLSERPSAYITKFIDAEWDPLWPNPPFPAFPSGHAIQSAATATVLTGIYGDNFHFTDSTYAGRPKDEVRDIEFKPRTFNSFWDVAKETADSRFFGGIHTKQDNDKGLLQGKIIGNNVNKLLWLN